MKLESMYQEIILDHYRTPHHKGLRDPFDAEVHHVNPTCGDEAAVDRHAQRDLITACGVDVVHLGVEVREQPTVLRVLVVVEDDLLVHRLELHQLPRKNRLACSTPATRASMSSVPL